MDMGIPERRTCTFQHEGHGHCNMKWRQRISQHTDTQFFQRLIRLVLFVLLTVILLILIPNITDYHYGYTSSFRNEEVLSIRSAWVRHDVEGGRILLSMTLPDELPADAAIAIETDHQTLVASVNGEELFRRTPENPWYIGREIGRVWNIIAVPESASGQVLELLIDNYAGRPVITDSSMLSNQRGVLRHLFLNVLPVFIFVTTALVIGIILVLFSFGIRKRGMKRTSGGAIYLAASLVFITVQIAADSYIVQFYQWNLAIAYMIAQMLYILLPIPFMQYLRAKAVRFKLLLDLLGLFQMGFLAYMLMQHYIGERYLVQFQPYIHFSLLIYILSTAFISIDSLLQMKEERADRVPLYAILFVDVTSTFLLAVYTFGDRRYPLFFYIIVIEIIFLTMLSYDLFRNTLQAFVSAAELRSLKKIAYEDALTGLSNRTAFDRDVAQINLQLHQYKTLGALVLDLNNLKMTNDGQGHYEGDVLIAATADLIQKSFGAVGHCYRYGGDEFIVLLTDDAVAAVPEMIVDFREMIDSHNSKNNVPISISWGSASIQVSDDIPGDEMIKRILKTADERMYVYKQKLTEEALNYRTSAT